MANRFVFPIEQRFDGNGSPLAGGKLYFYENKTSTPKDTYADEALTTPNDNPVEADSDGVWPDIWMDGTYTVKLTDADDVQFFSKDDVDGPLFQSSGSGADEIPTNALIGSFLPSVADGGTDAYEADFGRDVSAGETVRGDFGSASTTTTPTLENTGGTPGAKTITTKDGSALWSGALSGVHTLQLASDGNSWLALDPNPLDGDQPASVTYVDAQAAQVFLASYSPSAASSLDITSVIDGAYERYKVIGHLIPDTDNVAMQGRVSTDDGASWDSGASDYRYVVPKWQSDANSTIGNSAGAAFIEVLTTAGSGQPGAGTAAGEHAEIEMIISQPSNASLKTVWRYCLSFINSDGDVVTSRGSGMRDAAQADNAIQLFFGSGNIESGAVSIYGLR